MSRTHKTVLVTGASRGIGRATARYLSRAGMTVFAGVRASRDGEALEGEGDGIQSVAIDIASDESVARAAQEIEDLTAGRGLVGLVNNAGVGGSGPLEYVTREQLEHQFGVNVFGTLLTTQAFLPQLRRAKGRIINIGASNARLSIPLMGVLSATKFALEGLTDALRVELRRSGIRVCLIEPGMTYSDEDKPLFAESLDDDFTKALQTIPDEHQDYYRAALERARDFNRSMLDRANPAETVARCVERALTSRRPRARYWSGLDGKLGGWVGHWAPAPVRDALWGRIQGL